MDWLINPSHTPPSHPQSTAVRWFLAFQRMIINLSPSHKGTGQPIMEACSYCGSHVMGGHVTPAVTAPCLSKESRCGNLLICTVALFTPWNVFDDILPLHVSFPSLLSSNLQLPRSRALIVSRACIFWLYFLSFLSSCFLCLILLSLSFILFPVFHLYLCMQHAMLRKRFDISLNTTCTTERNLWASFVLITITVGIGRALKRNLALLHSF